MNAIVRMPETLLNRGSFGNFDGLFHDLFSPIHARQSSVQESLSPALDIEETVQAYVVTADLPGVKREDLDVTIKDGVLTIQAEARVENESETAGRVIRKERRYGKLVRSVRLGSEVDEGKVEAEYRDGVLRLTLPKVEAAKPKKIEIKLS